jgi:hypothetical protein
VSEDVDIRASTKPKSDQLNFENFLAGPQTFTVAKVTPGDRDHPVFIHLVECPATPYKPSKGMLKCIAKPEGWGDKSSQWVGKAITLYGDPTVIYGGVEVGGIKVAFLSGIEGDYETLISARRGVRKPHLIKRLIDRAASVFTDYPEDQFSANIAPWRSAISAGKITAEQVISKAEQKGKLTDEQKAAIRAPVKGEAQ